MSRATATAPVSYSSVDSTGKEYRLKSDIAQFCLPAANRDENRKLAYINSLCIFYIVVGLLGLRNPFLINREPVRDPEIVPVIFTPESPPPPTEPQPEEPQPQTETPVDTPVIATVVAADPTQVSFAVPVDGPVIFAPAKFAQAPPPSTPKAPTQPTRFVRDGKDGGFYPDPEYPVAARRPGQVMQGSVVLDIKVDEAGTASVEVKRSSGYSILDRAAVQAASEKWRFPPGTKRWFIWEFQFALK